MKYNSITELIGNTPHLRLGKMFPEHEVWIKLERNNPGGSIKDRIALGMIEDAEEKGWLVPGGTIIEPTSGNMGIGLSLVAALKGYKIIITMPESMSLERRKIMAAYGAEIVLTPRELGMQGAIDKAVELAKEIKNSWIPRQFDNPANPNIHKRTTAQEILRDFPDGFDYFIGGVGTGGHISGVGEVLKEKFPRIKIIAVEPESSPVISGGTAAPHALQGIGAGFIPSNLNTDILDSIVLISKEEAYEQVRALAHTSGVLAGISTGAVLAAAKRVLAEAPKNSNVLLFNYDTGERYLSLDIIKA